MEIELLQRNDVPAAAAIIAANYGQAYGVRAISELMLMFNRSVPFRPTYYAARDGGDLLGFAGYLQAPMDYGIFEIFWVNVTATRQRQGIGKNLVQAVIEAITREAEARLILLTTDSPDYYRHHFGFAMLQKLADNYLLMSRPVER